MKRKLKRGAHYMMSPLNQKGDPMRKGKFEVKRRREGALQRLEASKFFEKNGRTEKQWQKRKDKEIEILEGYLGLRQPAKKKREEITLD